MSQAFGWRNRRISPSATSSRGFSLVELMVAMVLGLVLIGGVVSVFLSNSRAYQTNTALGDVQANARTAFALLTRDIRQAGLIGCNSDSNHLGNVLSNGPNNTAAPAWWANWDNAVHGFGGTAADAAASFGSGSAGRVSGTDSVMLLGAVGPVYSVKKHDAVNATFKLGEGKADVHLRKNDLVLVCDPSQATLAQVTAYDDSGPTLTLGLAGTPGNCSKGLGFPTSCDGGAGNSYTYIQNSMVSKYGATDWFVGNNPVGGHSLYRVTEGGGKTVTQEMVRNVADMQIRYHLGGSSGFVAAASVGNWSQVDALKVTLTLVSTNDHAGTDHKAIQRRFTTTTAIRNRVN